MAAEEFFELLDSYWFEHEIFTKKPVSAMQEANPVVEIPEEVVEEPKISRLSSSLHVRSLSDQFLSSTKATSFSSDSGSFSPNSALKLQTIISGKEVIEFSSESGKQEETETETEAAVAKPTKSKVTENRGRGRRRSRKESKSLSDLEFEELKGFMDLGFVFSEEDKDSSLVSIIPGLQRLMKKTGEDDNKQMVSRPYLSEAWDVLDQKKIENPLMKWRVPALQNEVNMKDHLRFWAHTVALASTVR
ncbi:hypothetical protein ACOSQ2_002194 [Xanthoceras sorbifolium]|uniref:Uncharacterized protein n=1 Tax=Xanthoceras sorbifolium TaxID=99658 RepID=A0ABQ8IK62_9ROSI|nr:hypothetical protein JRO89_XS01G0200700 [Xanthoceras sorbifolium]